MAFAGSASKDQNNPFVTEKDLIRQVASNISKEALVVQKTKIIGGEEDSSTAQSVTESKLNAKNVPDAKRLMLENLSKVQKVWFSFAKFLKNQVTVNGKLVDTQLIGLFFRDNDDNGSVVFWPSVDYLEAGKFKLSKTSTK